MAAHWKAVQQIATHRTRWTDNLCNFCTFTVAERAPTRPLPSRLEFHNILSDAIVQCNINLKARRGVFPVSVGALVWEGLREHSPVSNRISRSALSSHQSKAGWARRSSPYVLAGNPATRTLPSAKISFASLPHSSRPLLAETGANPNSASSDFRIATQKTL